MPGKYTSCCHKCPPSSCPPYTTMVILNGGATHVCGRWVCGKECAKWVCLTKVKLKIQVMQFMVITCFKIYLQAPSKVLSIVVMLMRKSIACSLSSTLSESSILNLLKPKPSLSHHRKKHDNVENSKKQVK